MSNNATSNVAPATSREFASGQKIFGRYTLIKVLGRGGMGIVWLARDEELERNVALKFLPDLMTQDHAAFDQLKRETKRCLELTHPHIVRIYDFIHDERSGCISMECVDGETLSNLRAEKEQKVFEPDEIAPWINQLCQALEYAHTRANVVHCDLKPANLMVNQRGDLKITDFGIARSLGDSLSRLTAEQGRRGTLVYMSPQQLNGERCTHLDDIYSLGATIYELLTSKPPFYSGNIDRQICERVAPSMSARRKELEIEPAVLPPIWEDAVAACLAKDPARRPQSAVEVTQRLQLAPAHTRKTAARGDRLKKKALFIGGMAALFVPVLLGFYLRAFKLQRKPVPPLAGIPEKSIAVLPFENRSEEKANAYFADGIQDEILTRLSKIADLKVISRTSTQHYKSSPENLPEIARELRVSHILEGSVQKSGDAVRVNVQLINAATDAHVWADTFDRKLTDLFSVESEVSKAIAEQLRVRLTGREEQVIQAKPTDNPDAYNSYLRGLALNLKTFETPANTTGAQSYLRQAVRLDPKFALAWAMLSSVDSLGYISLSLQRTVALREEARQAAETAFTLQPNLAEAILAKGHYYYACVRDYDIAVGYFEQARQLMPNSSQIPAALAFVARRRGEWDKSESYFNQAERLDPRNTSLLGQHALFYSCLRRFAEAFKTADRILEITPDDIDTLALKAAIIQAQGDLPRAAALLAPLRPAAADISALETQVYQAILERRPAQIVPRLKELLSKPNPLLGYYGGELRFWLGWAQEIASDHAAAHESWLKGRGELESFLKQQPENYGLMRDLALTNMALGDETAASASVERAMAANPIERDAIAGPGVIDISVRIAARFGRVDPAIAGLQKLLSIPYSSPLNPQNVPLTSALVNLDPMFDPLRNDARFEKLIASPLPK